MLHMEGIRNMCWYEVEWMNVWLVCNCCGFHVLRLMCARGARRVRTCVKKEVVWISVATCKTSGVRPGAPKGVRVREVREKNCVPRSMARAPRGARNGHILCLHGGSYIIPWKNVAKMKTTNVNQRKNSKRQTTKNYESASQRGINSYRVLK